MTRNAAALSQSVHQRYRQLIRAGFTPAEAGALIAYADGLDRHGEGQAPPDAVWTWQEIERLEFLRFLADRGQLGGPGDG